MAKNSSAFHYHTPPPPQASMRKDIGHERQPRNLNYNHHLFTYSLHTRDQLTSANRVRITLPKDHITSYNRETVPPRKPVS